MTPLREQLALLAVPSSCNGRCTEGANSQPNENELLAPKVVQACVWLTARTSAPPPGGHQRAASRHPVWAMRASCSYGCGSNSALDADQPDECPSQASWGAFAAYTSVAASGS